ncbi:MAG: glycosyltransferase [Nannocystaceae bacterium]
MSVTMEIVSTTLASNNEEIIGDALRSVVDWVDRCIVVDTGASDRTLDVAREVAGDKLIVRSFPWVDDFSAARNFALDAAAEAHGTWAVTVDTDERIELGGMDIRAALRASTKGMLLAEAEAGHYAKPRFVRLPSATRWRGPTHESLAPGPGGNEVIDTVFFRELPKDAETARRKFQRDLAILTDHTNQHPHEPRWQYYLGETLYRLGRTAEAIEAFGRCSELRGWNEESAWACYRSAVCQLGLGDLSGAIDSCVAGMARHAGLAELPWLAGLCSHRLGRHAQAVYWSRLATTWGEYRGERQPSLRIGFRHMPGLYEGPYDVLRFALRKLGDHERADQADIEYRVALRTRWQRRARPRPAARSPS